MENFLLKNRKALMVLFGNLFFLSLFFIIVFRKLSLEKYINYNLLIATNITFAFFSFYFLLKKVNIKYKKIINSLLKYTLIIYILLIAATSILNNNSLINNLISIVFILNILFLFFYLDKEISKQNEKLSAQEDSRLAKTFQNLKQSKKINFFILTAIIILAFILRILNLTILDPYTDEYYHLLAGKIFLDNGILEYTRAPLVSLTTSLFYWIGKPKSFYEFLFLARMPSVIFGTITIIPIYLLAKKINKLTALISSLLWATSPWAIGVSRNVREYAYYPFFILLSSLFLINLIELILKQKKEYKKIILYSISIISIFLYAFFVDTLSTLKIIVVPFTAIIIFYLIENRKPLFKKFVTKKYIFILIFICAIFTLFSIFFQIYTPLLQYIKSISLNFKWLYYFFETSGSPMNWWNGLNYNYIAILILGYGTAYSILNKKREHLLFLTIFLFFLSFFIVLFSRYIRPRYSFYTLPFFIILISYSVYLLFEIFKKVNKYLLPSAICVFLLFLFVAFNYKNIIYSINSDSHGYIKTTNEYHDKINSALNFLNNLNLNNNQVYITTFFDSILQLEYNISKNNIYKYSYRSEERFSDVEKIVNENESGLMILDSRRNGYWIDGYPKQNNFFIGNKKIEIIYNNDGIQIYSWNK